MAKEDIVYLTFLAKDSLFENFSLNQHALHFFQMVHKIAMKDFHIILPVDEPAAIF